MAGVYIYNIAAVHFFGWGLPKYYPDSQYFLSRIAYFLSKAEDCLDFNQYF